MDVNNDGKIHVSDVIATSQWLCSVLRDAQLLFEEKSSLRLTDIADETLLSVATPLATDGVVTLEAVKAAIASATIEAQAAPEAPYAGDVIVSNQRHYEALALASESLDASLSALRGGLPSDLLSEDIRQVLYHLGTITGEISSEDILKNIFSQFCIGK